MRVMGIKVKGGDFHNVEKWLQVQWSKNKFGCTIESDNDSTKRKTVIATFYMRK